MHISNIKNKKRKEYNTHQRTDFHLLKLLTVSQNRIKAIPPALIASHFFKFLNLTGQPYMKIYHYKLYCMQEFSITYNYLSFPYQPTRFRLLEKQ